MQCSIQLNLDLGLNTGELVLTRKQSFHLSTTGLPCYAYHRCDWIPFELIENGDVVAEHHVRFLDDLLLLNVCELELIQAAVPLGDECGPWLVRTWENLATKDSKCEPFNNSNLRFGSSFLQEPIP